MAPLDSSAHAHLVLRKCKFCAKGGEKPLSSLPTSSPPENQPKEKKIRFPLWFLTTPPPPQHYQAGTPHPGANTHTRNINQGLHRQGKGRRAPSSQLHQHSNTPLPAIYPPREI